ncbi:hypothetical protein HSTV2_16 [Halorubrum sodomense tailed virus 2]|uniref:PI3K/PI4K catalytic domain-containing protein n=1 Tax=Halorubrum sodomense tailed virus 2 TaxID=1262527 RepID=L7TJZ0_9CAUD|nr:hypothetical protein HSTV2_16 [Halorubrum sodomense tailed virus 2]AGC34285.1 hypothetical protein HSTV2_16 [Halorubrum sodomense tailed virus 2]
MGKDLRFDYDVEGVEKTMRRIRRGLREGMEKSADDLIGRGKDAAKDRIYQRRRIWNKEVYRYGWYERVDTLSPTRVQGFLANYAKHARVVDEGRRPGATAPQVQHIIDWVDDKVTGGWSLDTGDGNDGGFPPTTSTDTHAVLREDASIKELVTGADAGLSDSANSRDIRKVTFDSGDEGVFKPNKVMVSEDGVVQNEEVVHRFAEKMGWVDSGGFPASRQRTITDLDGTEKTGNIQAFVDSPTEVGDVVRNYYRPESSMKPEDFAEENMDFAARLGVLDYIVGNDDRHYGNILMDGDNKPWAIDSGGHTMPSMNMDNRRSNRLVIFDEWANLDRMTPMDGYVIEDPERMHATMNAILDRQEEIFRELRDSPDLRDEIIEMAEGLHSGGTTWSGHYEDLLSDDSSWRYAIFKESDDWGGDELWQYDIDRIRGWLDDGLGDREPEFPSGGSDGVDSTPWWDNPMTLDDSDALAAIDRQLDYLVGTDNEEDAN